MGKQITKMPRGLSNEDRFWRYINKTSDEDCWIWTGGTNWTKHGRFVHKDENNKRRTIQAHRYSYELEFGKIPDGMYICHHCDNPSCVNPRHLFVGTQSDNMYDMYNKGRHRIINEFKGEKQINHKLTTENVLEILELLKNGLSQSKIAKRFGVSASLIGHIHTNKAWKWVNRNDR